MSLEDRLAAWGAAELAAAGDPPPLQVPSVRRRWAPLAAAAAAVAVAGGAVLLVSQDAPPAPKPAGPVQGVVPWKPLEPLGLQPSPLPGATVDTSVRACQADDLAAEGQEGEAATAMWVTSVALRNASTTPCRLEGDLVALRARLVLDAAAAEPAEVDLRTTTPHQDRTRPVVLGPGEAGRVELVWVRRCDDGSAGRTYKAVTLELLSGRVAVPPEWQLPLGCGTAVSVSALGGPPSESYAPDPVAELVPSLQLPATVRAGEVLRFTVTLTNPTVSAVALDPCPDFLLASGTFKESYALNCAQADPVPGGGREVFAMELPVPAEASGTTTVTWSLGRALGQETQGTVKVLNGSATDAFGTCTTDVTVPPCVAGLQAGETYPYSLYTHCGLRELYADGRAWRPVDGQVTDDGSDNPPPGVGNPFDRGTLRVDGPDRVVWMPASGKGTVAFRPETAADPDLGSCD